MSDLTQNTRERRGRAEDNSHFAAVSSSTVRQKMYYNARVEDSDAMRGSRTNGLAVHAEKLCQIGGEIRFRKKMPYLSFFLGIGNSSSASCPLTLSGIAIPVGHYVWFYIYILTVSDYTSEEEYWI